MVLAPRPHPLLLAALMVLAPWRLAACSDDETEATDVGPSGNPTIALLSPASSDPQPICVAIDDEPDARVPLLVETTELVLRPPGACGYYVQCGHLALYVDDVLNNESAVPAIDLLLRKLGDRYHDGSTDLGTGEPDVLRIRVDVVDAAGETMNDHAGEPLSDTVDLVTVPSCAGAGGGGG